MNADISCVYPYIKNYSRELEWSIKSLKNVEHGEVYVIGLKPDYEVPATFISPQRNHWSGLSPYNDVINKILQACNLDISDDFLYMNDDLFILDAYNGTTYDRGDLLDHINGRRPDSYTTALRNTLQWLRKNNYPTKDFETHTPIVFNRDKMKQLIDRILPRINGGHNVLIRSLYGNVYGVDSEYMENDTKNPQNYIGRTILSTNENTFIGKIGQYIMCTLSGMPYDQRRIKIAANIHYYIEEHGSGGELYIHGLLKELAKKHDVTAYIADDYLKNKVIDGVNVNYTDSITDAQFDILITHFQKTVGSQTLARTRNVRLVTVVHNNMDLTKQYLRGTKPGDLIIYNSQWIKTDHRRPGLVLTPPIKKVVKKTVKQDKVLLVNLIPEKGSELFFQLAREMPDIQFLGVKGGYYKTRQSEQTLPNLTIIENAPDMDSVYSQTKVVLMPSSYESFGMVASEAAQIGIPTIAHPTPGLKENLDYAGIFVDRKNIQGYKEEIRRLFDDKEYYKKYSKLSKQRFMQNKENNQLLAVIKAIEDL